MILVILSDVMFHKIATNNGLVNTELLLLDEIQLGSFVPLVIVFLQADQYITLFMFLFKGILFTIHTTD